MVDLGVFDTKARDGENIPEYYLVRAYKGSDPYSMITDLPLEEAERVSREAFPQRGENYMADRFAVDGWLREQAQISGVAISRANPISFSLVRDLDQWEKSIHPDDGRVIIPFREADLSNWSFTVDDSFVSAPRNLIQDSDWMEEYPKEDLHGRVLNGQEIAGILIQECFPEGKVGSNPRYFEAQLWANEPTLIKRSDFTPEPSLTKYAPVIGR
ncbi:MAG: hypothetical protein GW903_02940 [Alphaproteobacteria bacterium]|nr:hypothetical protein [Alphaproteobacteria bacterium]NCQ87930.1 hypothetical protein [Alphaproteobacteria bacterium]